VTPEERAAIIRLLPCYRMGQLEPSEADAVRRALHDDVSLRELLATIQDAERLCAATLRQGAPEHVRRLAPVVVAPALGAKWSGLAILCTVCVLFGLLWTGKGAAPESLVLQPLEGLLNSARIESDGLVLATTPVDLQQALLAAHVPSALARVEDLRPLGLTLQGGLFDGERVAVVWRDDTGKPTLWVKGPRMQIHRTPDQILRPDTGDGPVLQGHALVSYRVIYWERQGLGHALVGLGTLDQIASLAFQSVWKPAE
jgi:anti-sigma factor RsiW